MSLRSGFRKALRILSLSQGGAMEGFAWKCGLLGVLLGRLFLFWIDQSGEARSSLKTDISGMNEVIGNSVEETVN